MDYNFSKFTLLVRKDLNESTAAAFLAWSVRLLHSGIERRRNDSGWCTWFDRNSNSNPRKSAHFDESGNISGEKWSFCTPPPSLGVDHLAFQEGEVGRCGQHFFFQINKAHI